jgi:hypothetical protein
MIWLGTSSIEFANFVKLFSLPSLRVLYLSDFVFDEACGSDGDDDIIPHIPIELSQKSGVKNLTLTLACMESGPLIALLQLPGALEKFAFWFVAEDIPPQPILEPPQPVSRTILRSFVPHRDSLKEMGIVGCRDVRNAD